MKRFLIGMTLALALAAPNAMAAPSEKVTQQVHTLLSAPEDVPSAAEWQKLGTDAAEVLRTIALDEKTLVVKRGRAAVALQYFKSDASQQTLVTLVQNDKAFWLLRGKAARSLVVSYGDAALTHVQPLLAHDSKRLREEAIKAVGLVASEQSRAVLTARLPQEKSDHLKGLIRDTLSRLQKSQKGGSR